MTDFDDLDTYNGDTEHDMWVDSDHFINTGIPEGLLYEDDLF